MNNLKIRQASEGDLEKLAETYTRVYEAFDVGEHWTPEAAFKMLLYYFKHQPDLAFVAEDKGRIVGAFLIIVKPWCDGNRLFDGEIFVDPLYQSRGIGKKLLKKVLKTAQEKYNVKSWDVTTFKKFDFPLSWYKKLGFQKTKERVLISGNVEEALSKLEER